MPRAISRRAVLGGAASAALVASSAACAQDDPAPPVAKPDVAVLTAAIAGEERLIALYQAARDAHSKLTSQLDPALAHHREHLAVLRRHYVPGTDERTITPAPVAPARLPDDEDKTLTVLRRAESEAAAARASDVERVAPGVAQLMASIGACEAGHAAVLARSAR